MRDMRNRLVLVLVLTSVGGWIPDIEGCSPAWRRGESGVSIANEEALIIWDARTKTQQFIRRGTFQTGSKDFAFLVPTPTKPTSFKEVDDSLFEKLKEWTKPREIRQSIAYTPYRGRMPMKAAAPTTLAGGAMVEELARVRVGDFLVSSLKAKDVKALQKWLTERGYDVREKLEDWLEQYVKDDWVINVYKIVHPDTVSGRITTKALCMTFQTAAPFYPYREPADMRAGEKSDQRLLRVYYLGEKRASGQLGRNGALGSWTRGKTVWSNDLPNHQQDQIEQELNAPGSLGTRKRLTVFEDTISPRAQGTEEVYFAEGGVNNTLERDPVIVYVPEPPPPTETDTLHTGLTVGTGAAAVLVLLVLAGVTVYFLVASRSWK